MKTQLKGADQRKVVAMSKKKTPTKFISKNKKKMSKENNDADFPSSKVKELSVVERVKISLHDVKGKDVSSLLNLMEHPLKEEDIYSMTLDNLTALLSAASGIEAVCNMLIAVLPNTEVTKEDRVLSENAANAVDLIAAVIYDKFGPRIR